MNESMKIIAIAAVTIDGKIARNANHPSDWTSPEDKAAFRKSLVEIDAIIIGHTTYRLHESRLVNRRCIVFTRSVVDQERKNENLLFYNPQGPTSIRQVIQPYYSVAVLGGTQVYSYFLEHELIDEIYLTIEPIIFGEGLNLFQTKISLDTKYQLTSIERLNSQGTMLLRYKRI
jgi:dihydrofolate reductase